MRPSRFFQQYGRQKRLYPVVHVIDVEQALINTDRAMAAGADGVFLISHSLSHTRLTIIANAVRVNYPDIFLGINYLDLSAWQAFEKSRSHRLQGLWVDDSGIGDVTFDWARQLREEMQDAKLVAHYFASVAFKGQRDVYDIAAAARLGADYSGVVVTSGNNTGYAPALEKIVTMKEAIPDHPLAIASGMTVDNIASFLPYADIFMVATGISRDFHNLDSTKVADMVAKIKDYNEKYELLS